jgi:hypothetical protein
MVFEQQARSFESLMFFIPRKQEEKKCKRKFFEFHVGQTYISPNQALNRLSQFFMGFSEA